jgi:ABC-type transport system involved in cytochrome c biogenesis permease subunit
MILVRLASLKLAVILLVLLLVALAAGTIVESAHGREVAGRTVYYAGWFLALQAVLAVNVLASIAVHFPWNRRRIGFLMTHGSLILIVVGACITYFFKTEGQLALWEGETSGTVQYQASRQAPVESHHLPFQVRLDDFQIDYYQGTRQPAQFRSKVHVIDGEKNFAAEVYMNHPLHYKGWSLFQSSYRQEGGREATILSVSKDPGQLWVFIGYTFLVLGMCVVLATRISMARVVANGAPVGKRKPAKTMRRVAALMIVAGVGGAGALKAGEAPAWPEGARPDVLRALPVQHDGRVMPLDTLAREAVWNITGERGWRDSDPVDVVLQWTFEPLIGVHDPVVKISDDLAAACGMPGIRHLSFMQAVQNNQITELMRQAQAAAQRNQPRVGLLEDVEELEGRLVRLRRFVDGEAILPVPAADPNDRWKPAHAHNTAELAFLLEDPGARFAAWPSEKVIDRELLYNGARPSRLAWWILGAALIASLAAWNTRQRWLDWLALAGLVAGFAVMTWGIAIRWQIAGRIPATNMYESLLFLAWGVGLFAVIAFALMRNRMVVVNANVMAGLTMFLTDRLPIDGFIHPAPPVLSGTPWLAIHVPIIMVSYAVLALGVVIAHMQIGFTIFGRRRELVGKMSDLLYWYTMIGSILLIAGILTGSIWAASSWGRYWGWDPKEVWSLVAFLAYIAILHARWDRMIGPFSVAAISVVAFQTILMTYLGVNYVLAAGLHSYGFGSSSVVNWMVLVALLEIAFIGAGYLAYRARERRDAVAPA